MRERERQRGRLDQKWTMGEELLNGGKERWTESFLIGGKKERLHEERWRKKMKRRLEEV